MFDPLTADETLAAVALMAAIPREVLDEFLRIIDGALDVLDRTGSHVRAYGHLYQDLERYLKAHDGYGVFVKWAELPYVASKLSEGRRAVEEALHRLGLRDYGESNGD